METKVKRREWVKSAAIVFLSVLLVLTFFSNTIMNRSLPEVAAQYVESGSINARIRGTGTVAANEVYEVSLSQTRKVQSVLVKVGQEVLAGDPLLRLESMESEELKAAQKTLDQMELSYQMALVELSNSDSQEDRQIQKLREDYEEALTVFRLYSNADPDQMAIIQKDAEADLNEMKREQSAIDRKLQDAQDSLDNMKSEYSYYLGRVDTVDQEIADYDMELMAIDAALSLLKHDKDVYQIEYDAFVQFAKSKNLNMEACANDYYTLAQHLRDSNEPDADTLARAYAVAYDTLTTDTENLCALLKNAPNWKDGDTFDTTYRAVEAAADSQKTTINQNLDLAEQEQKLIVQYAAEVADQEAVVLMLEDHAKRTKHAVEEQELLVQDHSKAANAADALKAAEEALEDAVFESQLGSSQNLQLQADREAIEAQKKLIEELSEEADGKEITANVSGVISAIHVSAGGTAAAEQPAVEITVADRGYTVSVPVTTEQARQVRVGDTAQITNYYWGDITATLENIANDPQSMGKQKLLIFRISGEGVEAGTNLTLSIGQRSANYDCLVPNSAIRSDANGSFVLVVTAKSSPLGNRYVANRVEVQVLASDDTMSAVTGLANGDFVITTSTKPLEAGDMVRLPDNG